MIGSIKSSLNSVEVKLLLNSQYDKHYGLNKNTEIDNIFGPTLFKVEEYIESTDRLDTLLDIYTSLKINKLYNLSLREFLSLNRSEINVLVHHARKTLETQNSELEDMMEEE